MVAVMAAVMLTSRRSSDDGHEREKKPSGSAGCFAVNEVRTEGGLGEGVHRARVHRHRTPIRDRREA